MTIEDRRNAIKAKVDTLDRAEQLETLEAVVANLAQAGEARDRRYEISDERHAELMRRARVAFEGGGISQEDLMREYGYAE